MQPFLEVPSVVQLRIPPGRPNITPNITPNIAPNITPNIQATQPAKPVLGVCSSNSPHNVFFSDNTWQRPELFNQYYLPESHLLPMPVAISLPLYGLTYTQRAERSREN